MEIIGYLAALLIGLSLGLTGSGGSILTVPILVYLMRLSPVMATSYSLFVVGTTSLVGGYNFYRQGLVNFKASLIFGLPSLITVYLSRKFLIPAIPEEVFRLNSLVVTKELLLMVLFALLMILASYSMIIKKCCQDWKINQSEKINYWLIVVEAIIVGLISGLVGAGGGFLIIPVLVIFIRLDMKMAVGTSLYIIAANSLFGFVGDIFQYKIDWRFLLIFSALSIAGIFIGSAFADKTDSGKLKRGFGWFVLVMGVYILFKEIFMS
ncbi:sulfite exporter TauE/SafE family protein [Adhaeribacter radiodurans]|uniref:Probable membrane transporter protein n=1 Tax=Adhaeribacter radiodurans TaxID=2745197 RepID=A0A7L7L8N3_9BACT|nr:sulfite exporter TauE/SafE family protein [Adhaeribacter radiodurans]QMU28759.1 sulfite exporter TauE/SafE family protein [Adhaeribacter radiodurans]